MLIKIELLLALLGAVAGLQLLSRRATAPYPILLVIGGLVLALIPGLPHVVLNPEIVFLLFLPPLLYPAALFTPWRDFKENLRPILLLAIGHVLFTTISVGYLAHYFIPGMPLSAGFALGAIISPPDALAATAIAERLRLPRRIIAILEGESLVNDATALVALRFAIVAMATGSFSIGQATVQFFVVSVGGVAVGLAVGWISARLIQIIDDPPIEITIALITPFAAYLPAEQIGVSGVLAVVTAGLYDGWKIPEITSSRTRLQAGPIWLMLEFLLNGFIFLLIGLQLPEVLRRLSGYSINSLFKHALMISLAVIVLRILWVFPATYLSRLLWRKLHMETPKPDWRNVVVIAWTGMRGVVSLAAAMALPHETQTGPFPGRDLILFLTFVVILVTLVVQGLSLPWLIQRLRIKDDLSAEQEERVARIKANEAALARLDELAHAEEIEEEILHRLRAEYEDRLRQLDACEPEKSQKRGHLYSSEYERLSQEGLRVERRIVIQLRNEGVINDEVLRRIQRDIDLAEARLQQSEAE